MKICFDIDNTVTVWDDNRDYINFVPIPGMVEIINQLYDDGHEITLYTSRGMRSCGPGQIAVVIVPLLVKNLEKIGLKYHNLLTHKPYYDIVVDDKAMRPDEFKALIEEKGIESFSAYVLK